MMIPQNARSFVIWTFFCRTHNRDSPLRSYVFQPHGRRHNPYSVRHACHSYHTKLVPNATQTLRLQTENCATQTEPLAAAADNHTEWALDHDKISFLLSALSGGI